MNNSQLNKQIKKAVAKNFPAQKKFLLRLINAKSANEFTPENSDKKTPVEKKVASLIYQKLKTFKFSPRRIGASQNRPNIVCYWGPTRFRKSLLFNGHMDTIAPSHGYKQSALTGKLTRTKLYGLGSLDMKAPLSAYIFALKALKDAKVKLDGRLMLQFVVDEEPGACSDFGTKYLLSRGIKAKAAIIAEPGPQIGIGHRGGYRFKLTTYGEAIHTGVSTWQKGERGKSAIIDMMKVIKALQGLDIPHKPSKVFSGKKPMITFPTIIKGGNSINAVPDQCEAYGDVRLMPGNSNKQVRLLIEEKLAAIEGLKYSIEDLLFVPAIEIDEKEELVETLSKEYTAITRKKPIVEGVGPWNDAWMLAQNDIPTITQLPLKGGGAHGKDEWVDLTSLKQQTEILARTVISYLGLRTRI